MCSPPLAVVDLLLKVSPYSMLVMPVVIGLLGLAMNGSLGDWITKQARRLLRRRRGSPSSESGSP